MNEISKPSKGAEKILLAQIKQEFSAPAEAIEHYVDLVEQYANENNLNVSDEIEQAITTACSSHNRDIAKRFDLDLEKYGYPM